MAIFRGLNTSRLLNDVDNKTEALANLGINSEDLDAIRGIGESVTAIELRLLAGLDSDQRKEFVSLSQSAKEIGSRLESLKDFRTPFEFNLNVDNRIAGSAIKFNYADFPGGASQNVNQADISTSRISSWSSTVPGEIFYGGEVKVTGGTIKLDSFRVVSEPVQKTFRSEVATHRVFLTFKSDTGVVTDRTVYAMKGIPLKFDAFFKDATLGHFVEAGAFSGQPALTDDLGAIYPTWRITNLDNGLSYNSGDGSLGNPDKGPGTLTTPATYPFRDPGYKPRLVEFFYPPDRIKRLDLPAISLGEWPTAILENLERLYINGNDFFELPKFGTGTGYYGTVTDNIAYAPNIQILDITGNNMSRAQDENGDPISANVQLQYLPNTITDLIMKGTFSDNQVVDLRHLENLKRINMDTYYTRDAARRMTGAIDTRVNETVSPNFNSGTASDTITVVNHGFYDNEIVRYTTTGTAPGGLTANAYYYITNATDDTFKLAVEGTATIVTITPNGTGTHTLTPEAKNGTSTRVVTNGIDQYYVTRQPYSRLADGLCDSTSLQRIDITLCDITRRETARRNGYPISDANATAEESALTIASPTIDYFYSYNNSHNIVDFSGNTSIYYYWHRESRGLPSYAGARTLGDKITGCPNLFYLNFYGTDVEDNIQNTFTGLNNLYRFDLRYCRTYGRLASNSLAGTDKLYFFLLAGGLHGKSNGLVSPAEDILARDDFFSANTGLVDQGTVFQKTPNLYYLWVSDNTSIGGDLPDLSQNRNLTWIFIRSTSLGTRWDGTNETQGAPLPSFTSNSNLYYVRIDNSKFSGQVPSFKSNRLRYIYMGNNRFDVDLPVFECPQLWDVYLNQNQIPGVIPNYSLCTRLQRLYLNQNLLNGYTPGAIAENKYLSQIDFSNNLLTGGDGVNIINDLAANYSLNPRPGVSVNLINQNGLTEAFIINDISAGANLSFLRSVGWSIQLSP